ncbi:MarR family winged helix-turn-helix transcriptional regulator [Agrococcus sp. KRD186]|jgi:DNA-binding MarR family transcriptional regulator|uniref:MarR family winged helix-turn-helix transcriptional regulator n=1 Tax=Agrococcus sp. KRD186 TaxID=2729730 RepID=UPI00237BC123|nr:MarR family transcriptional regulator [Agrococcus sp. KRD186]
MPQATPRPPDARAVIDARRHEASAQVVVALGLTDTDVEEIVDLFASLVRWRSTSDAQRDASRRFMRLGENDMRAIRFLMTARHDGAVVTSTMLAEHLGLKGPSVTKLLDRLEQAGHIRREAHPSDRRALSIVVTDSTSTTATATVGADHLRRFRVAAAMSSEERRTVTRFLSTIADLPVLEHGS